MQRHVRHIQLKASFRGSKIAKQKVHLSLAEKPSGCVVWVYFDPDSFELGPFLYFGDAPGKRLPDIESFKIAKHTKGNAQGVKAERPNQRVINKGKFKRIDSIEGLWDQLFGHS